MVGEEIGVASAEPVGIALLVYGEEDVAMANNLRIFAAEFSVRTLE